MEGCGIAKRVLESVFRFQLTIEIVLVTANSVDSGMVLNTTGDFEPVHEQFKD